MDNVLLTVRITCYARAVRIRFSVRVYLGTGCPKLEYTKGTDNFTGNWGR